MAAIRGFSLENVKNIRVVFSTFDSRVSAAREVLRRVSSTKLQQTNPKCQVKSEIFDHQKDPSVEVTFSDGTKAKYDCLDMTALKVIEQINIKSRSIQ